MDWSFISQKYDSFPISEFVYIWYEFDAKQSYDQVKNKTSAQRNKFKRIKAIINYLLTFIREEESIEFLEQRPNDLEEYKMWANTSRDLSLELTKRAFAYFQDQDVLTKKVKTVDDFNVSNFIKILKVITTMEENTNRHAEQNVEQDILNK